MPRRRPALHLRSIRTLGNGFIPQVSSNQSIDFENVLKKGAIGLQVEEVDGAEQIIRVYDLDPA